MNQQHAIALATQTAYQAIDAEMVKLFREARALEIEIPCRAGCANCCTYVVAVLEAEASLIADHIQTMAEPERSTIINRLHGWVRQWLLYSKGRVGVLEVAVEWQVKRIACPLLDLTTGTCRVYAVRPAACRTHHAANFPVNERFSAKHAYQDCGCPVRTAPEGCFTSPEAAAHRHSNQVWQVSPDTEEIGMGTLVRALRAVGVEEVQASTLPEFVLKIGAARHGWRHPPKLIPLPIMAAPKERR